MPNEVQICYRNHRVVTGYRHITLHSIRFGNTEYHPRLQWLLEAFDHDKIEGRTFAVADILSWKPWNT